MDKETIRQLISEKLTGVISDADEQLLTKLVDENPDFKQDLLQAEKEYAAFLENPHYSQGNTESNWENIEHELLKRKRKRRNLQFAAATAIIIAIVVIGTIFLPATSSDRIVLTQNTSPNRLQLQLETGERIDLYAQPAEMKIGDLRIRIDTNARLISFTYHGNKGNGSNILKVPPGMDYQIILSDSSKVHLNCLSELTFPLQFKGPNREISITGESYMEIVPHQSPFIVKTAYGTVRVLGTTFNINTYDSRKTKVSLVKGKVACAIGSSEVTLQEGKAAIINNNKIKVANIDENDLAWLTRRYPYRNATLIELSRLIYRIYGVEVVIDNKIKTQHRIFSGTILRYETLQSFMENMELIHGLKFYYKEEKYHWR